MPKKPRTILDKLFLIIKGLGMGAANKVPGVSGGIVAFVAGFYVEFIYSLPDFYTQKEKEHLFLIYSFLRDNTSSGMGNTIVEFFSLAIFERV